MKTKLTAIILSLVCLCLDTHATDFSDLLLGKGNDYLGMRADNGNKSGACIKRLKDGGTYVGDINRDKFNGRGMLIAGNGTIKNLPGAYVYIGSWVQGKKSGRGTCYAANGDIIYSGKFEDDKPVSAYPQPDADINAYFSMINNDDQWIYIGEVTGGAPEGFGITIQTDGAYWIGTTRDGQRRGVSTFLYGPDAWSVVNYKNGDFVEINSSDIYNARRKHYAEVKHAINSQLWSDALDLMNGIAQLGQQYAQMKYGNSSSDPGSGHAGQSYSGGSSGSKSGHSSARSASNDKKNDCGSSWMSDSRVYSNYETQLIKGGQSADDRQTIRDRMRRIREKWTARGCLITKSPHE